jgi:phosphopantetheine adenylyltransferase
MSKHLNILVVIYQQMGQLMVKYHKNSKAAAFLRGLNKQANINTKKKMKLYQENVLLVLLYCSDTILCGH